MSASSLKVLCSNTDTPDMQTSIRIICDLLRAGISEVCHRRNILEEECFTEVVLHGIRGQTFACKLAIGSSMSGPKDSAHFRQDVINLWCKEVERLLISKNSAISRITFGFSSVEDTSVVLEEYLFDIDARGAATSHSENSYQYQAMDLLESLSLLVRTLDPVPWINDGHLYLFVKAYLAEGTHVTGTYVLTQASEEKNCGISYYKQDTFEMKIGTLRTAHHSITIGVCSTLDSVNESSREQLAPHEYIPDNLEMCSSVENATEVPSPFQFGRLETPKSVQGKMLSEDMKKLQASPSSSSMETGRLPQESNEESMLSGEISCMNMGTRKATTCGRVTKKSLKKRGKRLAGLLSTTIHR